MENLKNLLVGCILILSIHLFASAQGIRRISEVLVSGGFPNATVRVCTEPAVGVPCTPLATIYSDPGLTQVASNPLTTDASGNYAYFANPYATYHEQISGNGLQEYDIPYIMLPISGAAMLAANNTWTGINTFFLLGTSNCSILNGVRCVSPSNPQGWAGSDPGAWINAAATCSGCEVVVASGTYLVTTPIVLNSSVTLSGVGPSTILQWVGSNSGKLISTASGGANIDIRRMQLITGVGGTTIAVYIPYGLQVTLDGLYFNGTGGSGFDKHVVVTGDGGTVNESNTVSIYDSLFQYPISAAVAADHVANLNLQNLTIEPFGSITASGLVFDSGTNGVYMRNINVFNGIHGLWLKCTGVNSTAGVCQNDTTGGLPYNAPPWAIFIDEGTVDSTTGDGVLFDGTLGANVVDFVCTDCWITTSILANCIHINGGQKISWLSTRVRAADLDGIMIDSANVSDVTIVDSFITNNNQANNVDAHGVYVTASVHNISIRGNRIGNITEPYGAGNQKYGVKVAVGGVSNFVMVDNNLANNVTGPYLSANTDAQIISGNIPLVGYQVTNLPSAASNSGLPPLTVTDSTAVSVEGQTCVGGNSNTALAFSNGSVWKCF